MKRTIVAIALLTLITSADARPPQQAEQLAGQLAQLLGTKEMFSAHLEQAANAGFQKFAQDKMGELYKKTYAEVYLEVVEVIHKYQKVPK